MFDESKAENQYPKEVEAHFNSHPTEQGLRAIDFIVKNGISSLNDISRVIEQAEDTGLLDGQVRSLRNFMNMRRTANIARNFEYTGEDGKKEKERIVIQPNSVRYVDNSVVVIEENSEYYVWALPENVNSTGFSTTDDEPSTLPTRYNDTFIIDNQESLIRPKVPTYERR
jgi:hypothetical protein